MHPPVPATKPPDTRQRSPYGVRARLRRLLHAGDDVTGCVDGVRAGRLHGWAADLRRPAHRIEVRLHAPGWPEIAAVADRYRADVQVRGLGDGCYGFAIPLFSLAAPAPMQVLAGPARIPLPTARRAGQRKWVQDHGALVLALDGRDPRQGLTGWAVDRRIPELRCELQLRSIGGNFAEVQRATLWRADLGPTAPDADCLHGFAFRPTPPEAGPFVLQDVRTGRVLAHLR